MNLPHSNPRFPKDEELDGGPVVEVELSRGRRPVFVDHAFQRLELRLGYSEECRVEIVSGLEWPQVGGRYVVMQPEILAEDPRRGWAPVGGAHDEDLLVDPAALAGFSLPAGFEDGDGVLVRAHDTFVSLIGCGAASAVARLAIADLLTAAEASRRSRALAVAD